MKHIFMVALIVMIFPALFLSGATVNLSVTPEKYHTGMTNWVFKAGPYVMTADEFEMGCDLAWILYTNKIAQMAMQGVTVTNPMNRDAFRSVYLGNAIYQTALLVKGLEDPRLNNPTNQFALRTLFRQAFSEYYVREMMAPDMSVLQASREEIDQFYKDNREKIEASGLPITDVIRLIQNELAQKKFQFWQSNMIMQVVDKTEIVTNSAYFH